MNKIYSGFHQLPHGNASTMVQEGCIVLEGGAFRGLYGEGVLDALMLENINLRCTIGVSGSHEWIELRIRSDWQINPHEFEIPP